MTTVESTLREVCEQLAPLDKTVKWRRGAGFVLLVVLSLAGALVPPAGASAAELYASNHSTNTVSPFAIGGNGSLTPLACAGTNCNSGSGPVGLAVSPNGRFLYSADYGAASVSAFSIGVGGSLTAIACNDCTTGYQPFGVAVSPDGQFLYTSNVVSGTVSAFSITAGGSLNPIACTGTNCTTAGGPEGVAVSPNGKFLYTADDPAGLVSAFAIRTGGSLTPIACAGCTTGSGPVGVAISPNGRFLYAANSGSNSVSAFSIAGSGSLSPIGCTGCATGPQPYEVAISPNGLFLYTIDRGSSSVSAFSIAAGGSLIPIACADCTTGSDPEGVAVSPNGRSLYTVNHTGSVSAFSITAAGSLTPIACGCSVGLGPDFQAVAITPDQAPVASFTATPPPSGRRYSFNGSSSSASAGQSVARYDWNFGDGSSAANAGPSPARTYAAPGVYTVSLTVTDDAGCSTQLTFTGQVVSCNGSPAALKSERITVAGPRPRAPVISRVRESAKTWREAGSGKRGPPVGTELWFTLNESATVSLSFKRHRAAFTLTVRGHQGVNRIRFTGRVSRIKKLEPGRYTLVITATNATGERSTRRSLRFTIVR
jgi:6-phosphogluconolactonase (cycloisomerase 2 family)